MDELDDELGHVIAGSGLAAEDEGARLHGDIGIELEALVEREDVKHLEVLALVLVDALDEDVEEGVGIDGDRERVVNVGGEAFLVVVLDGAPLRGEVRIFNQRLELAELFEIVNPALSEARGQQASQTRVAKDHPAARRDAIGFVAEFLWGQIVEIAQHVGLQQLGMQLGHAVDGMAAQRSQMRHAHESAVVFIHQGKAAHAFFIAGADVFEVPAVDLFDDFKMTRKQGAEEANGPLFKSLGHEGVVGVSINSATAMAGCASFIWMAKLRCRSASGRCASSWILTMCCREQETKKNCCSRRSCLPWICSSLG